MDTKGIFCHCEDLATDIGKLLDETSYTACTPGKRISPKIAETINRACIHLEKARYCLQIIEAEFAQGE